MMAENRLKIMIGGKLAAAKIVDSPAGEKASDSDQCKAANEQMLLKMQKHIQDEKEKLAQARQALESGVLKLRKLQDDIRQEAEGQLAELAVDVARKVLMQDIHSGHYEIDPIVAEALMHVPPRQNVVVHLNPDDWAQCEMVNQNDQAGSTGKIRFVSDPQINRAECLIETPQGTVESVVETHLESIGEAMMSPER